MGILAAAAADRRPRVGDVPAGEDAVARARPLPAAVRDARARLPLSLACILIGVPIWYVVGHPRDVLTRVRQGDGHDAAAQRRPRGDVLLHGAGAGRSGERLDVAVDSQPERRPPAVHRLDRAWRGHLLRSVAAKLTAAFYALCFYLGVRHRLLGRVRDHRVRTFRHQPARDGHDHRPELRQRGSRAADVDISGADAHRRPHVERHPRRRRHARHRHHCRLVSP